MYNVYHIFEFPNCYHLLIRLGRQLVIVGLRDTGVVFATIMLEVSKALTNRGVSMFAVTFVYRILELISHFPNYPPLQWNLQKPTPV